MSVEVLTNKNQEPSHDFEVQKNFTNLNHWINCVQNRISEFRPCSEDYCANKSYHVSLTSNTITDTNERQCKMHDSRQKIALEVLNKEHSYELKTSQELMRRLTKHYTRKMCRLALLG